MNILITHSFGSQSTQRKSSPLCWLTTVKRPSLGKEGASLETINGWVLRHTSNAQADTPVRSRKRCPNKKWSNIALHLPKLTHTDTRLQSLCSYIKQQAIKQTWREDSFQQRPDSYPHQFWQGLRLLCMAQLVEQQLPGSEFRGFKTLTIRPVS